MPEVILKPRKARPFHARHPWVLGNAVHRVVGQPADGDAVDLLSDKGKWIARGIYHSQSKIRVRLYSWNPRAQLDIGFWREKIRQAVRLREQLGLSGPQAAVRLIHSEADGISGLVVDKYANYVVVQCTALATATRLDTLIPILAEELHPRGILVRTERQFAATEGIQIEEGLAWGLPAEGPLFIEEHGIRFGVDTISGQKTGLYLDQRDNRKSAAQYVKGRRVLDLFCYTGGFSLAAAQIGKAHDVLGVDSSRRAVETARANAELNSTTNVSFEAANCFQKLESFVAAGKRFGAIILDPPKFAASYESVAKALGAYHRLNRLAVSLLEPDGILVTCSCTGRVTGVDFARMLSGVASKSGRDIQILEKRGAAADHPVSVAVPETEYLKCFICRVGRGTEST